VAEFRAQDFLPAAVLARLTEIRVNDPERVLRVAQARQRRARLTTDGKLNILAADHPARRVTGVGDKPLGMADRHEYLTRIVRVLLSRVVDGVMATIDILEDLLLLHDLSGKAGGPALLDDKLLIASLNRGGLAGAGWEMDDPLTGPSPAVCAAWNLDGAKILLRICDDDPASLKTMLASAQAISEANTLHLPTFLEPLPTVRTEEGYKIIKTANALAKVVGVASALGNSSRYLWLKLPYCEDYEVVARATTLPILLLGGEAVGDVTPFLREVAGGLAAGLNVRGALVGRNVLYPGAADPLIVAEAVGGIIHHGWPVEQALLSARDAARGKDWFMGSS
jgi:DhnA family fructose-bisphosphate aldolase class Ia